MLNIVNISQIPYVAEEKEGMDIERYGHTLIYSKNMLFAIGGTDNLTSLSCVEVYHPSKDYWEELESLNKERENICG